MLEMTSLLLSVGLVFGPPNTEPNPEPSENVLRIVDSAPTAEPPLEAEPIEFAIEPPPPTLEPDAAPPSSVRMIDSKRPAPGTGFIALGSMALVASSGLIITALAGPGWLGLERGEAAMIGGLSIPIVMSGVAIVAVGDKSARRFRSWSSHNDLSPPETGNGMIVAGAFTTLAFAGTAAYATQWALTKPDPRRVDWLPTAAAGGATLVGMLLLTSGMLKRSKFSSWEQHAYAMPGAMALEHGGGVSVAGRF
jgi:hypothetical protein